jgi:hypothetical protein
MLGFLMFSLTKARGYVDPYDSLLGYFIFAGFTLLLLGVVALYVRYAPVFGQLGKIGLGTAVVGVVLLAVGHRFSFMGEIGWMFIVVLLGAFALMLGPLLFGIAVLREEVLPRYGRVLPLLTGLMGVVWLFFNGSETGQLTFSFMIFRSLFALGWILLGYVLWSDGREIIEHPSKPGLDEPKVQRSQPPISNGGRSSSYSERRRLHR